MSTLGLNVDFTVAPTPQPADIRLNVGFGVLPYLRRTALVDVDFPVQPYLRRTMLIDVDFPVLPYIVKRMALNINFAVDEGVYSGFIWNPTASKWDPFIQPIWMSGAWRR